MRFGAFIRKFRPGLPRRGRRAAAGPAVIAILAVIAGVALLYGAALVVINRVVIPRALPAITDAASSLCDCTVEVGRVRVTATGTLVARGVTARGAVAAGDAGDAATAGGDATAAGAGAAGDATAARDAAGAASPADRAGTEWIASVEEVRVPLSLALLRGLRSYEPSTYPPLRPWNVSFRLYRLLSEMASARVIPDRVDAKGGIISLRRIAADAEDRLMGGLSFAAFRAGHESEAGRVLLEVTGWPGATGSLAGTLQVDYRERVLAGEVSAENVDIDLSSAAGGAVSLRLGGETIGIDRYRIEGGVAVREFHAFLPAFSDEPIQDLDVAYQFSGEFDPEIWLNPAYRHDPIFPLSEFPRGELLVERGEFTVNGTAIEVSPSVRGLFGGLGQLAIRVRLPQTPVQEILRSLPAALTGALAAAEVSGTLEYDLDVRVPFAHISDMKWTARTELDGFAVRSLHESLNVYKLNDAFVHTINADSVDFRRTVRIPKAAPAPMDWMLLHSEHTQRQVNRWREEDRQIAAGRPPVRLTPGSDSDHLSGAGQSPDPSYTYVRLQDMSPWIVRTILTAEDGDFFFYGGVNWITFAGAIERNVAQREIAFGASTISMQLMKILFLDQQRIVSRKLQEVMLVYLMEHQVPVAKDRILELYLNLAEFGPGIYGISDAARVYFSKHPRDLTAGESAWLATVLPAPKIYSRAFREGHISWEWYRRMVWLYDIMLERGRMTPQEYQAAVSTPVRFRPGTTD